MGRIDKYLLISPACQILANLIRNPSGLSMNRLPHVRCCVRMPRMTAAHDNGLRPMNFDEPFRAGLRNLLTWRRDVRRFRADPLPQGTLERLIGMACLAPSVG
jgi:hypothetical protein